MILKKTKVMHANNSSVVTCLFYFLFSTVPTVSVFCVARRNTPRGDKGAVVLLPRVSPEG